MFICQKCGKVSERKVSPIRKVVETRVVEHPRREYVLRGEKVVDPGGTGMQIVREEIQCPECAKE